MVSVITVICKRSGVVWSDDLNFPPVVNEVYEQAFYLDMGPLSFEVKKEVISEN